MTLDPVLLHVRRGSRQVKRAVAVQESPEGGFGALSVPIFTEADTVEELRARVRGAVECHFDEVERPRVIHPHFGLGAQWDSSPSGCPSPPWGS